MATHPPFLLSLLGMMVGIVGVYCVSWLAFTSRHWRWFATQFPAAEKPSGHEFLKVRGWFGASWFGPSYHRLRVVLSAQGIYVAARVRFRGNHLPIFVPWSCVSTVEESDEFVLVSFVEVAISLRGCMFTLRLPSDAIEFVRRYYPAPDLNPTRESTVPADQSGV